MKKILFISLLTLFCFASCQNTIGNELKNINTTSTNNNLTNNDDNSTTTDNNSTNKDDNSTNINPLNNIINNKDIKINDDGTVNITSARNLIFINETTEDVDSVTYNVKNYADLYTEEPYFYTFYKLYYLNGKLRGTYTFYHGMGSELDYKYNEFVEHICGNNTQSATIYTYYDNGKIEKYIQKSFLLDGSSYQQITTFDGEGKKEFLKTYTNNIITSSTQYYSNGGKKNYIYYNTSVNPPYMANKTIYYENGKEKIKYYYNANGVETSRTEYIFYDSGNLKTKTDYDDEIIYSKYDYFDTNSTTVKKSERYRADGTLQYLREYYENGNEKENKEYYADGTLKHISICYENGKTKESKDYNTNGTLELVFEYYETGKTHKRIDYNIDGLIEEERSYYQDEKDKLRYVYNTDRTIHYFYFHYSSGYTQYYYTDSGYFYTYDDGKTTNWSSSSSVYSSKVSYTQEQAKNKLQELLNQ